MTPPISDELMPQTDLPCRAPDARNILEEEAKNSRLSNKERERERERPHPISPCILLDHPCLALLLCRQQMCGGDKDAKMRLKRARVRACVFCWRVYMCAFKWL